MTDRLTLSLAAAVHAAEGTSLPADLAAELELQTQADNRRAILRRVSSSLVHQAMGGDNSVRAQLAQYDTTPEAVAVFLCMVQKQPDDPSKPLYTIDEITEILRRVDFIPASWRFTDVRAAFRTCRGKRLPNSAMKAVRLQLVELGIIPDRSPRLMQLVKPHTDSPGQSPRAPALRDDDYE